MIFDNAIEQAKAAASEVQPIIKLADVTSVSNGKALVTFYGETDASTKYYAYIVGYKPVVGDKVALLAQGNTYIILGKVSTDDITNNYYPTAAEVANTYESQTHASNTYLSQTDASSDYLSKTDASNDYLKKTDAQNTYRGKSAPFEEIKNGSYRMVMGSDGIINIYGTVKLGALNYQLKEVVTNTVRTDYLRQYNSVSSSGFVLDTYDMHPYSNNGYSIGTSSSKLSKLYATNIYGTVADSSDRRFKKTIKTLGRKWLDFFYRLRPTSFKYKDGTSDRTHTGFIAQEVEEAARESGMGLHDIAAIVIDSDGRYSLRYQELIAVQTLAIHDLKFEVDELTRRVAALERAVRK